MDWTKHSDILPILLFSSFPSTTFSECCSSDLLRLTWLKKKFHDYLYKKKENFQFRIAENKCNSKKSKFCLLHDIYFRAYSKLLLGATIAPNLVSWVLRKIFSLEMVKNDICLGGASKQNVLFSENMSQKKSTIKHQNKMQNLLKVNTKRKNQCNQYHHINGFQMNFTLFKKCKTLF